MDSNLFLYFCLSLDEFFKKSIKIGTRLYQYAKLKKESLRRIKHSCCCCNHTILVVAFGVIYIGIYVDSEKLHYDSSLPLYPFPQFNMVVFIILHTTAYVCTQVCMNSSHCIFIANSFRLMLSSLKTNLHSLWLESAKLLLHEVKQQKTKLNSHKIFIHCILNVRLWYSVQNYLMQLPPVC